MDKSKINMHKRMAMGMKAGGMKPKKMAMGAMALGALGAMAAKKMMGKKSSSTDKMKGGMGKMLAGLAMKKKKQLAMGKMGGGMMDRYKKGGMSKKKMMGGGVAEAARRVRASEMKKGGLKAVDKEKNPGLAKLPTRVRNKMGYMKRGGKAKK